MSGWGWQPDAPPQFEHLILRADETQWEAGAPFERRDLGLSRASNGVLRAELLRPAAGAALPAPWSAGGLVFDLVYVLSGELALDGVELAAGDAAQLGPDVARVLGVSADLELLRIAVPAVGEPGRRETVVSRGGPDTFTHGDGLRSFFGYRDLGVTDSTGGRIKLQVISNSETAPGTGWHWHSMSQWVIVLKGTTHVRVEAGTNAELGPFDVLCLGHGPDTRHNVGPIGGDYACIELCAPATYSTTPVPLPAGAEPAPPGGRD